MSSGFWKVQNGMLVNFGKRLDCVSSPSVFNGKVLTFSLSDTIPLSNGPPCQSRLALIWVLSRSLWTLAALPLALPPSTRRLKWPQQDGLDSHG